MKKRILLSSLFLLLPLMLSALEIRLTAPREGETVPLLNAAQKAYISLPRKERIAFFADADKRKKLVKEAGYYPLPVKFAWQSDASEKAVFKLFLSEKPDMSSPLSFQAAAAGSSADNLKIGCTYYWQLEVTEPGKKPVKSKVGSFVTENRAPRLMRFPNVPNVRDLGGRKGLNGMYVKQNKVFRTAGMNNNARNIPAKTDEELFASYPEYGKILPLWRKWQKEFEKSPQNFTRVKYALGTKWSVFKFDKETLSEKEIQTLDTLTAIPAELFGVKPEIMSPNRRDRLALPFKAGSPRVAVLMQEFTAPASGMMQIASGADDAWDIRINGQLVFSRIRGNGKNPTTSNYHYFVPVRQGKNLVTVVLKSGKGNWMWCCGKRAKQDFSDNIAANIADVRKTAMRREPGASRIKPEGRAIFLDQLKVKSDIDLRSDRECCGMKGSPLGESVTWFHISSSSYGGMQGSWGKAQFTKVFKVFLDEKNYPVIFHCIAGQDRTGAVAFILNGLLGVEEEELYLDWEVTGFWNPSARFNHARLFNNLINGFRKHPGNTLREKIEHYILECGFTPEDIAKFRTIMLEKK